MTMLVRIEWETLAKLIKILLRWYFDQVNMIMKDKRMVMRGFEHWI